MPLARRLLPPLAAAVLFAPAPAAAQEPMEPVRDRIVLSGDVLVRRGEEVGEVVVVTGRVWVAGVVRGDVVVLQGRVLVTGQVSGSVVVVSGPVALGESSQVAGDVIAEGRIRVAEGAMVDGEVREGVRYVLLGPVEALGRFASWAAVWASVLALGLGLLALAPRGLEAVARAFRGAPFASLGWGIGAAVLLPLLGALGVVSLLWLPLGLGLLAALFLLAQLGAAWGAFALGRLLWREPRGRLFAFVLGWAILAGLGAIPRFGVVPWVAAAVVGVGAATVAAWRARRADPRPGGRHRPGAKMGPVPMIAEPEMGEGGTGL